MNAYRTLAKLSTLVLLIGSFLPGAYAWRTAVSTTDPGNTDPGFTNPDGLTAPWQDGATPVPTTAGTKIWIAINNYHIATNTKTVALGLINPPGVEPRVNSVEGYYDTADGGATVHLGRKSGVEVGPAGRTRRVRRHAQSATRLGGL